MIGVRPMRRIRIGDLEAVFLTEERLREFFRRDDGQWYMKMTDEICMPMKWDPVDRKWDNNAPAKRLDPAEFVCAFNVDEVPPTAEQLPTI
jgi:hypothetical protein